MATYLGSGSGAGEVIFTRRLHCICEQHIVWICIDVDASWTNTWYARALPITNRSEVWVIVCMGKLFLVQSAQIREVKRWRCSGWLKRGVVPVLIVVVGACGRKGM